MFGLCVCFTCLLVCLLDLFVCLIARLPACLFASCVLHMLLFPTYSHAWFVCLFARFWLLSCPRGSTSYGTVFVPLFLVCLFCLFCLFTDSFSVSLGRVLARFLLLVIELTNRSPPRVALNRVSRHHRPNTTIRP